MNFSIKDFYSKCDQIRRKLRIWSHLLKKSLMENFIFCGNLLLKATGLFKYVWRFSRHQELKGCMWSLRKSDWSVCDLKALSFLNFSISRSLKTDFVIVLEKSFSWNKDKSCPPSSNLLQISKTKKFRHFYFIKLKTWDVDQN